MNDELKNRILEALQIGYEATVEEAINYHAKMAGYRQYRHDAMDADVKKIKDVIDELEAL